MLESYDGDRVAIGEIEAMDWQQWAKFYGEQLDELHLPFPFRLIETPWDGVELANVIQGLESAIPPGGWPILAIGNHDRRRIATRLGRAQARVAAVLLLTLRGVPTILYGDELGMVDEEVAPERRRDHFALAGGVSHDGTRTPMPWTSGVNGGFSTAAPEELWLPVGSDFATINVESQLADPNSSLNLYRRLLALRRESAAMALGEWQLHNGSDRHCLVYTRRAGSESKLVALNLTDQTREVGISQPGTVVLSTSRQREGERVAGPCLSLMANEAMVIDQAEGRSEIPPVRRR